MHAETRWLGFATWNILPPLAFYALFQSYGAKPAVALAIVLSVSHAVLHGTGATRNSPFFLVSSFFTVTFGTLDLIGRTPQFYRFEPFFQNMILGVAFAATVFTRVPIAAWFAEGLPAALRPNSNEMNNGYLRKVTGAWAGHFFAKAMVFLYLAFQVTLAELVVLRSLIGGSSLLIMIGGEILIRKRRRLRGFRAHHQSVG
ncbi:MAG: hypothetical protein A2X94_02275 [Bdellovibrionales bacterium GWB1_55_8]|nr:MAG: hypothetical protein A2X94_02275 [Bdellovibrionales bacterium GWB1_55_8]